MPAEDLWLSRALEVIPYPQTGGEQVLQKNATLEELAERAMATRQLRPLVEDEA